MEAAPGPESQMRDVSENLSAEENKDLEDLYRFSLSSQDGKDQRRKAVGQTSERLRVIDYGVVDLQAAVAFTVLDRRLGTGLSEWGRW